jgi:hypothetical protein
MIHYWGIRGCERKLADVLQGYANQSQTIKEFVASRLPG